LITEEEQVRARLEKANAETADLRAQLDVIEAHKAVKLARAARAGRLAAAMGDGAQVHDYGGCLEVSLPGGRFSVYDSKVTAFVPEPERAKPGPDNRFTVTPAEAVQAEIERLEAMRQREWAMRTAQLETANSMLVKIQDMEWP
jgi:hypothetical protein